MSIELAKRPWNVSRRTGGGGNKLAISAVTIVIEVGGGIFKIPPLI